MSRILLCHLGNLLYNQISFLCSQPDSESFQQFQGPLAPGYSMSSLPQEHVSAGRRLHAVAANSSKRRTEPHTRGARASTPVVDSCGFIKQVMFRFTPMVTAIIVKPACPCTQTCCGMVACTPTNLAMCSAGMQCTQAPPRSSGFVDGVPAGNELKTPWCTRHSWWSYRVTGINSNPPYLWNADSDHCRRTLPTQLVF